MRCYFTRADSIQGVTFIRAASDEDLIEKARQLFATRGDQFDGFEVWQGDRFIYRFKRDDQSLEIEAM